jgi:hypothetical protein
MPPRLNDPLTEPLQRPLTEPLHRGPNFDNMSDAEIMAMLQQEDTSDKYAVRDIEPPDMHYQFARIEVFGKGDFARPAELEQKGWRAVPNSRHPGRFMSADHQGPIEVDGLRLYELPRRVADIKKRLVSKAAEDKVRAMNEQLIYSPAGTGPRVPHRPNAPVVRREAGATEMMIE